jgi:non-ribosomal peptide synthetase component F
MLSYTSGTTGNPKGVLYSHRSTVLHALGVQPQIFALESRSVMLPVVPMFHAACWGIPWGTAMVGASLVFSAVADPAVLTDLMERHGVTSLAGVPTVWLALADYADAHREGRFPPALRDVLCGGSALPPTDRPVHGAGAARQPCLGHDRNLAHRHRRGRAVELGRSFTGRTPRAQIQAGAPAFRRRDALRFAR